MISTKYRANIETIPNKHQRFRTCGDSYHENDNLQIRVSSMRNKDYEFLTAIKAQVQQYLCERAGIKESAIDSWRLTHENEDEPGELLSCPYREQHLFAEAIEKVLADKLGVDWVEYGKKLEAVMDEKPDTSHHPFTGNDKPSKVALLLQTKRILQEQEG